MSTVQEVHRQHTLGLGTQELPPGERRPHRRRSNPGAPQNGPHGAGPDPALVPQTAQLAMDAAIPPGRVPPDQPQHHRAEPGRHGRPATPVPIGPAPPDQVLMPPQQRGRLHEQPPPGPAGQQPHPAQPAPRGLPSRAVAGPPDGAGPRPRGATRAARRPWPPNFSPVAQATAAPGRAADRAVEESCADHRGPATPLANLQLSTTTDFLAPTGGTRRHGCGWDGLPSQERPDSAQRITTAVMPVSAALRSTGKFSPPALRRLPANRSLSPGRWCLPATGWERSAPHAPRPVEQRHPDPPNR